MIKDTWNMIDSLRLFGDAEEEVVVLGAIKLRTETSDLPQQIAPDEREMADIVAGKKIVRRPIRLKDRRIEALLGEFVFIGVNQIYVTMVLQPLCEAKEGVEVKNIIVIEESHPFTLRKSDTAI